MEEASELMEEGASLMGGDIENPNPDNLSILADYWEGYPFDSTKNIIKIGPDAVIYGRIYAPRINVIIYNGITRDTAVYGSILTKQLVSSTSNGSFYIKIIGQ